VTTKNRKMLLPVLLSIALVFSLILPASVLNRAPVMAQGQVTLMVAADTTVSAKKYYPPECDVGDWTEIIQVAAGYSHTVGLKSDGTVVAVGAMLEKEVKKGRARSAAGQISPRSPEADFIRWGLSPTALWSP
jgi:hypothetical protein